MISGIGIDIIELDRIKTIINRQPKFIQRILTENEQLKFEKLSSQRKIEFLAGRFAAKEAFAKANGTGIGNELSFLDIEIESDLKGKPQIILPIQKGVHLSISHSRDYAIAQVIIEQ
ncbi:MAG TPA: holo-ACP synthase [Pseudoneobacillus sp.]|nr:holo-ACP synthase [Pseudoneobacillus sp.]